jgi:hypothetical protein
VPDEQAEAGEEQGRLDDERPDDDLLEDGAQRSMARRTRWMSTGTLKGLVTWSTAPASRAWRTSLSVAVVDWLRHHDRLRRVPMVVYTARDLDPEDRDRL